MELNIKRVSFWRSNYNLYIIYITCNYMLKMKPFRKEVICMSKANKPLKFKTPEELENKIEEYFKYAKDNKEHITITGLAWYLDCNRQTLLNYENSLENDRLKSVSDDVKVRYVDAIKRAKQRIEMEYEQALFNKSSVVGAIFTLKNNFGWVDKQEVEQTNKTIEVTLED